MRAESDEDLGTISSSGMRRKISEDVRFKLRPEEWCSLINVKIALIQQFF